MPRISTRRLSSAPLKSLPASAGTAAGSSPGDTTREAFAMIVGAYPPGSTIPSISTTAPSGIFSQASVAALSASSCVDRRVTKIASSPSCNTRLWLRRNVAVPLTTAGRPLLSSEMGRSRTAATDRSGSGGAAGADMPSTGMSASTTTSMSDGRGMPLV